MTSRRAGPPDPQRGALLSVGHENGSPRAALLPFGPLEVGDGNQRDAEQAPMGVS